MDIVTLSKSIFSTLLPFLKKSKSVEKITNDIKEAADTSLSELWNKVKPVFIEEFEENENELSEDIENEDVVGHVLKKSLKKDENFAIEISTILEKISPSITNIVQDSQNVVQGNISAGGNVEIGDRTDNSQHIGRDNINIQDNQGTVQIADTININHYHAPSPSQGQVTPNQRAEINAGIEEIKSLISKNKIKQAIEKLLATTQNMDDDSHNSAILLASRWNGLQNNIHSGLIDGQSATVSQNQIKSSLLYTLDELE